MTKTTATLTRSTPISTAISAPVSAPVSLPGINAIAIERAAQHMIGALVEAYLADGTETMTFALRDIAVVVGLDDTHYDVAARWRTLNDMAAALA